MTSVAGDREATIETIVICVAPSVRQTGWSGGAIEVYVREKLPELEARADHEGVRGSRARAGMILDRIRSGILNESFGP